MPFTQLMRSLDSPLKCYFVRHGESKSNQENIMQGHEESPLSDNGIAQARATAQWFAHKAPVQTILSSPLERAYKTACIIGNRIRVSPQRDPLLTELDTGILSGMSMEEAKVSHPKEWENFQLNSWEGVSEAESIASISHRALQIWELIVSAQQRCSGDILVVLHGGILQWVIRRSFSDKFIQWMPLYKISNCGIFSFSAHPVAFKEKTSYYGMWDFLNKVVY